MCNNCQKYDSKVVNVVDSLLQSIEAEPLDLIKASQASRWEKREDINPYFSHIKQQKRTKGYIRDIQKVFTGWKKRFNELYKDATAVVLFSLPVYTKKADLTEAQWEEIVSGSINVNELTNTMTDDFQDEAIIAYQEVSYSLFSIHQLNPIIVSQFPTQATMEGIGARTGRISKFVADDAQQSLRKIIYHGLESGASNQNIAKDIRAKFDNMTNKQAMRIARTETTNASNAGTMDSYKNVGIAKYDVLPALGACPICTEKAADNPYDVNDIEGLPSFHPNCRCTTVPVIPTG